MPPGIDISAVREAIQRRGGAQGGGAPLVGQIANEGGGAPSPVQGSPVPQQAPADEAALPATQATAKAAGTADTPKFDEETRALSKALIKKLLDAT